MRTLIINAENDSAFSLLKNKSTKDLIIVCYPWGFSVSNFYKYKSTEIYKKFKDSVYWNSREYSDEYRYTICKDSYGKMFDLHLINVYYIDSMIHIRKNVDTYEDIKKLKQFQTSLFDKFSDFMLFSNLTDNKKFLDIMLFPLTEPI